MLITKQAPVLKVPFSPLSLLKLKLKVSNSTFQNQSRPFRAWYLCAHYSHSYSNYSLGFDFTRNMSLPECENQIVELVFFSVKCIQRQRLDKVFVSVYVSTETNTNVAKSRTTGGGSRPCFECRGTLLCGRSLYCHTEL